MVTLHVDAKVLGQRRPVFQDWRIEFSTPHGDRTRLRDLITYVVLAEVDAFQKKQQERRLAQVLTPAQIEVGRLTGKIDSGERDLNQPVEPQEAVNVALQAFEDGLYFVFIDGIQQKGLADEVFLKPDSQVNFLRLVALAGG